MASGKVAELTSTNMRPAGILVFCLFSSILSTVTSLKCQKCSAVGSECQKYDTTVEECKADEEFCFTLVANTTITSTAANVMVKGCSKFEDCLDGLFVTTTVGGRFEIARANCCSTDLCNAEPFLLENYDDLHPNELECPGCIALNEDSCEANQTVFCVGDEYQCIELTSATDAFGYYHEISTYQGCTTWNSCSFPLGISEIAGGLIKFNISLLECRNASSSERGDH